jgi:hypothetical protein
MIREGVKPFDTPIHGCALASGYHFHSQLMALPILLRSMWAKIHIQDRDKPKPSRPDLHDLLMNQPTGNKSAISSELRQDMYSLQLSDLVRFDCDGRNGASRQWGNESKGLYFSLFGRSADQLQNPQRVERSRRHFL